MHGRLLKLNEDGQLSKKHTDSENGSAVSASWGPANLIHYRLHIEVDWPAHLTLTSALAAHTDVKSDGRISVAEVVACVEQMEFIVDGPLGSLARSVVPAAVEVDRLSLNDAIKVSQCESSLRLGGEHTRRVCAW